MLPPRRWEQGRGLGDFGLSPCTPWGFPQACLAGSLLLLEVPLELHRNMLCDFRLEVAWLGKT